MAQPTEHSRTSSSVLSSCAPFTGSASSLSHSQIYDEALSQRQYEDHPRRSRITYRDAVLSGVRLCEMPDDMCSCLVVLITFWFFASMTLIVGFYGSVTLELGPYNSRLLQANAFFVQSVKVQAVDNARTAVPILYGFNSPPPLDVKVTWSETHQVSIAPSLHKEWLYFLNKGSQVDISYRVLSSSSLPLSLVIAQGKEGLVEWIEDPSYPNTTLSWNIIHGSGEIQQEIWKSSDYYVAVGNMNFEEAQVQLNYTVKSIQYNTTQALSRCSLNHRVCAVTLFVLRKSVGVLTSPVPEQFQELWVVKLSYGPRWMNYIVGSGVMTVVILMAFKFCYVLQPSSAGIRGRGTGPEQAPLVKEDDVSSWGSSYDSGTNEEEVEEELGGKAVNESGNPQRICIICFDAPRDCFFLPCGHCAACFSCGSRIAEEAGTCPICRRRMKKVKKIFTA